MSSDVSWTVLKTAGQLLWREHTQLLRCVLGRSLPTAHQVLGGCRLSAGSVTDGADLGHFIKVTSAQASPLQVDSFLFVVNKYFVGK